MSGLSDDLKKLLEAMRDDGPIDPDALFAFLEEVVAVVEALDDDTDDLREELKELSAEEE